VRARVQPHEAQPGSAPAATPPSEPSRSPRRSRCCLCVRENDRARARPWNTQV